MRVLLDYIATVCGQSSSSTDVAAFIINSNPILEAFGNARYAPYRLLSA